MECLNFFYFADKLTEEMFRFNGFAAPGPSKEQNENVQLALTNTIKHFLKEHQFQKKSIDPIVTQLGKLDHRSILRASTLDKRRAGGIHITFYGESHDSYRDGRRACELIHSTERDHNALPTALVLERGMRGERRRGGRPIRYDVENSRCFIIDELNLTRSNHAPLEYKMRYSSVWGFGLSRDQRSMVVAAYLATCLGNSSQTAIERITILFGAEHENIIEYIEFFISTAVTNLKSRRRYYFIADSLG